MPRGAQVLCAIAMGALLAAPADATFLVGPPSVGFSTSGIAIEPGGTALVVWTVDDVPGVPPSVRGRRFDIAGDPTAGEFQINTTAGDFVQNVDVARGADGHTSVAWASYSGGQYHVLVRSYDPAGMPQGSDVEVGTETWVPFVIAVAVDASGGFLVTWSSIGDPSDDSDDRIWARLFDATGAPIAAAFTVNTTSARYAAVDAAYTGTGYVVAWSGIVDDDLKAQRLDTAGAPVGAEILVAADTQGVSVASDGSGSFLVASSDVSEDIAVWRYDGSGNPIGLPIPVSGTLLGTFNPSVAATPSGGFVVAWNGIPTPDTSDVRTRVRRFDASGMPLGTEIELSVPGDVTLAPAVAALSPDGFFVTWTRQPTDHGTVEGFTWRPDTPVRGAKIVLRDAAPSRRRVKLVLRDPLIATVPGAGLDPFGTGVTVQVFNTQGTGDATCLPLPPAGWRAKSPRPYPRSVYADKGALYGPCTTSRAVTGEFKISCRAMLQPIPYTLDEPAQGSVGALVTSGDTTYCTEFGGIVQRDQAGTFRAKLAGRPASCPVPPVSCP